MKRTWLNLVERAKEALGECDGKTPQSPAATAHHERDAKPSAAGKPRTCETCIHYLKNGYCDIGLELECRDGGFEAWEGRDDQK